MPNPARSSTCATQLRRFSVPAFFSSSMIGPFMACRYGNSERIVTDLRHACLVVGLRCATGGEVTGPVDVGEVDPAAEGQRDAFVADLAGGTGIESRWRCLIGRRRLDDGLGLRFISSLLASLNLHALLEL